MSTEPEVPTLSVSFVWVLGSAAGGATNTQLGPVKEFRKAAAATAHVCILLSFFMHQNKAVSVHFDSTVRSRQARDSLMCLSWGRK